VGMPEIQSVACGRHSRWESFCRTYISFRQLLDSYRMRFLLQFKFNTKQPSIGNTSLLFQYRIVNPFFAFTELEEPTKLISSGTNFVVLFKVLISLFPVTFYYVSICFGFYCLNSLDLIVLFSEF
jgi:hypothetical protein